MLADSKNLITELSIGDTVTNLTDETCFECSKLKKLTIGNAVSSIVKRAFRLCTSPDDVTAVVVAAAAEEKEKEKENVPTVRFGLCLLS